MSPCQILSSSPLHLIGLGDLHINWHFLLTPIHLPFCDFVPVNLLLDGRKTVILLWLEIWRVFKGRVHTFCQYGVRLLKMPKQLSGLNRTQQLQKCLKLIIKWPETKTGIILKEKKTINQPESDVYFPSARLNNLQPLVRGFSLKISFFFYPSNVAFPVFV